MIASQKARGQAQAVGSRAARFLAGKDAAASAKPSAVSRGAVRIVLACLRFCDTSCNP